LNFGQPDLDVQSRFQNPLPVYAGPRLPEHDVPFGYQEDSFASQCFAPRLPPIRTILFALS
jgi:hypothetical protein